MSRVRSVPVRRLAKRAVRRGLQGLLFALFTLAGLCSAAVRLFRRRPLPARDTVRRILVIRLDLLGDMVMSLPAIKALKDAYPGAEVTVLALPYAAGLMPLVPDVDHVLTYDVNLVRRPRELLRPANYRRFFALRRELRASDFDVCLSLHGKFACVMAWLSGCRHTYGYRAEAYPLLLAHRLPGGRYRLRQHEVLYNLRLAEAAGAAVEWGSVKGPHLVVPQGEQRRMRQLLAEFEIRPDTQLAVLHPGASNGSAKRWPAAYWAELATRLQAEQHASVVLTGAAAEAATVRQVADACSTKPLIMAGQTNIAQLGALLKRADLVVSSDTSVAHMAAALGTSQITLFGPTDPAIYAPFGGKALVLRRELACSPCYDATATAECRFGHMNCMRELLPDEVSHAAARLLARRHSTGLGARGQTPPHTT